MVFPTVAATATSDDSVATTSHTVSLPSGIVSGNLLIVGFVCDGDAAVTWPAGYTQFATFDGPNGTPRVTCEFAYRQADGTEGATITVTTDITEGSAHVAYRITGAEPVATQAPEASGGAQGNSTAPDPDNLTPTGGAKDYLWLACMGLDNSNDAPVTGFPASYSNGLQDTSNPATGRSSIGSAERQLNAASENPGAFTVSAAARWGAGTIGVHPVSAPPSPPDVEGGFGAIAALKEEGDL